MFINAEQIPAVVHGVLVISVLVMVTIIKVSIPSHWLFIMFGKNKRKKQKRGNKQNAINNSNKLKDKAKPDVLNSIKNKIDGGI